MIRVYCDSNIYRYLNPKHASFNVELLSTFESLKGKMLFTYSDAHLKDLKNSPREYVEADLLLMEEYVADNYFMHDLIKRKATIPYLASPFKAFKDWDFDAYDKALENPFDFDNLLSGLDEFEELKVLKRMMKTLFQVPIGALGNAMELKEIEPTSKAFLSKISPNYSPLMSIGDFMNDVKPHSKMLLKDKREMTELRKYIRSYMNRDEYSFDKWGIAFNERLRQSSLGKSYLELVDSMITENQKDNFYQRFSHAYMMLEIYNITQERTSKGIKQFTLESLNTDALHAWYGSFSDYLVTNDKGLQVKASIVYQLLGLPTKVLSLQDFINLKSVLLGQEETYEKFSAAFSYDLNHSFQLYSEESLLKEQKVTVYKTTHPYFNYFNRLQLITEKDSPSYTFFCRRKSHADFFMSREIELLVNKTIGMFGVDDDNKGRYSMSENENYEVGENIRKWTKSHFVFILFTCSLSWGNSVCLSLEIAHHAITLKN